MVLIRTYHYHIIVRKRYVGFVFAVYDIIVSIQSGNLLVVAIHADISQRTYIVHTARKVKRIEQSRKRRQCISTRNSRLSGYVHLYAAYLTESHFHIDFAGVYTGENLAKFAYYSFLCLGNRKSAYENNADVGYVYSSVRSYFIDIISLRASPDGYYQFIACRQFIIVRCRHVEVRLERQISRTEYFTSEYIRSPCRGRFGIRRYYVEISRSSRIDNIVYSPSAGVALLGIDSFVYPGFGHSHLPGLVQQFRG